MIDRTKIDVALVKLRSGERLLRLTDSISGLALEKKLDPEQSVVRQKERPLGMFEAALAKSGLSAA